MSFAEDIRTASNPPAALLVLAEGIDAILTRLNELSGASTQDLWAGWNVNNGGPAGAPSGSVSNDNGPVMQRPVVDNTAAIAQVKQRLLTETDPDEVRALQARLRLLEEDGQSIDVNTPAGVVAQQVDEGDRVVTVLPAPDANRKQARYTFARQNKLWEFTQLGEEEFVKAFAKGGPLWLYHSARDEVMSMPVEWRRLFVEDIHQDSPRTAHEVGRDILKDDEPTGTRAASESMLA